MDGVLNYLRGFHPGSVLARLILAMLLGGLLGLERERKHRPAGLRTYMVVCMGAALTMLLGQYLSVMLDTLWSGRAASSGLRVDVTRISAQVANGIGFLGAGTILISGRRQQVTGLTTAAGLWAAACMGLAVGAGFYECMLMGFVLIILNFEVFPILENAVVRVSRNMHLYLELESLEQVGGVIGTMKSSGIQIVDMEIERDSQEDAQWPSVMFSMRLPKHLPHTRVLTILSELDGIHTLEEI